MKPIRISPKSIQSQKTNRSLSAKRTTPRNSTSPLKFKKRENSIYSITHNRKSINFRRVALSTSLAGFRELNNKPC